MLAVIEASPCQKNDKGGLGWKKKELWDGFKILTKFKMFTKNYIERVGIHFLIWGPWNLIPEATIT